MRCNFPVQSGFIRRTLLVGLLAIVLGTAHDAQAMSSSRTFGLSCFMVGLGLRVGGIMTQSSAQSVYDDYLLTAVQADIQTLREDYRSKRQLSRGLTGFGNGLMVAGALWTAYAALRAETTSEPATSWTPEVRPDGAALAWKHRF